MEILNAKITSVSISMADHGCLTFWITFKGSGWGCSIGGYSIGHGYLGAEKFKGYAPGTEAMMRIMDTVGVERWEDLKEKYIRVECDNRYLGVGKIGHITDDKWFDIDAFFKSKYDEEHKNEAT